MLQNLPIILLIISTNYSPFYSHYSLTLIQLFPHKIYLLLYCDVHWSCAVKQWRYFLFLTTIIVSIWLRVLTITATAWVVLRCIHTTCTRRSTTTWHTRTGGHFYNHMTRLMLSILPIIPILCPVSRIPYYSHYYTGILGTSLVTDWWLYWWPSNIHSTNLCT